jgi:hypothetical protein
VAVFTFVAAGVVFCVVQDRVTAAGVRQYVALHRAAMAGRGPAVRLDDVMDPARRRSAQHGLAWGGVTWTLGMAGAAVVRRSRRG